MKGPGGVITAEKAAHSHSTHRLSFAETRDLEVHSPTPTSPRPGAASVVPEALAPVAIVTEVLTTRKVKRRKKKKRADLDTLSTEGHLRPSSPDDSLYSQGGYDEDQPASRAGARDDETGAVSASPLPISPLPTSPLPVRRSEPAPVPAEARPAQSAPPVVGPAPLAAKSPAPPAKSLAPLAAKSPAPPAKSPAPAAKTSVAALRSDAAVEPDRAAPVVQAPGAPVAALTTPVVNIVSSPEPMSDDASEPEQDNWVDALREPFPRPLSTTSSRDDDPILSDIESAIDAEVVHGRDMQEVEDDLAAALVFRALTPEDGLDTAAAACMETPDAGVQAMLQDALSLQTPPTAAVPEDDNDDNNDSDTEANGDSSCANVLESDAQSLYLFLHMQLLAADEQLLQVVAARLFDGPIERHCWLAITSKHVHVVMDGRAGGGAVYTRLDRISGNCMDRRRQIRELQAAILF